MNTIGGILLSGGQSSRMGQDKGLLKRDHRNMFFYTLDTLAPLPLFDIYISRNPWQIPFACPYPVVSDRYPNKGPLSGIHAVMDTSILDGFLIVPVDLPLIETYDLEQLLSTGNRYFCPVHFKDHYLPLYLPNTDDIRQYLRGVMSGNEPYRSIKKLCARFNAICLEPNDEIRLSNTNTPDQWREAELAIYEI